MRIVIFLTNGEPATPLLKALGNSLRTFDADVLFLNPDFVNVRERYLCDGALAMEGVDLERITTFVYEQMVLGGDPGAPRTTFHEQYAENYAGPDDTIILSYVDGKLALGDLSWDMDAIRSGEMSRFLLLEKPSAKMKVEPKVEPEKVPTETDMSGLPPPAQKPVVAPRAAPKVKAT